MNAPTKQRRLARRIFKGIVVFAIVGVLGLATLLGSLSLERRTELTLLQDGNVGVGVFPQGEEFFVGGAGFGEGGVAINALRGFRL
jgi:hypothetical protein